MERGILMLLLSILVPVFWGLFLLLAAAFRGIQVCVVYLIFSAGLKMLRKMKKAPFQMVILGAVAACMVVFSLLAIRFSTIVLILICGGIGLLAYLLTAAKEGKK